MSLPLSERRKLREIEQGITSSDPRLAGLYSMFAKLSVFEAMPRVERIRAGLFRRAARVKQKVTLWAAS
ncbi:hypothetical protein [Trebonia sp.]|uniref:hypothetical protein n=1 Tax=Trebonia sp. TaxID=2767075 RepID=UPI002611A064|nr:hypothetical protein [Trebonia sp.]